MQMIAAQMESIGHMKVKELPLPALNPGEALIKVKYCGVCGTDLHVFKGEHATAKYPLVAGHEFVGELVELNGVSLNCKVGDQVVAHPLFSCRSCEACAQGNDNVCKDLQFLGAHTDGGFAQYVKVPIYKIYPINGIDPKLAALTEPLAVAVHDVRRSGLKVSQTALVIGGGPIGLLIALVARLAGARTIVIAEISEYRRNMAADMGFTVLDPLADDYGDKLYELTDGLGFDVVYEVSGSAAGAIAMSEYAKSRAAVVVVGMAAKPHPVNLAQVFMKELDMYGVRSHTQYDFIGAIDTLKSGALDKELKKLVSHTYPLEDIGEAFDMMFAGDQFFKVLIQCN
ncbi:alcohol dehydrogenase catalytic domain-containing protein [Agathobaculum sp. TL06]